MLLMDSVVTASSEQVSCGLGDGIAILSTKTGVYYHLDSVGAHAWQLIEREPRSIATLRDAILTEYEVEPDRCERELLMLLDQFLAQRLIDIRTA